jgi:hypothetical protein
MRSQNIAELRRSRAVAFANELRAERRLLELHRELTAVRHELEVHRRTRRELGWELSNVREDRVRKLKRMDIRSVSQRSAHAPKPSHEQGQAVSAID